jgi:hypothetical protein
MAYGPIWDQGVVNTEGRTETYASDAEPTVPVATARIAWAPAITNVGTANTYTPVDGFVISEFGETIDVSTPAGSFTRNVIVEGAVGVPAAFVKIAVAVIASPMS